MEIPDRLYFKIGEVARIVQVKPHVLRYWESEFNVCPRKSKTNQRVYTRRDVETILDIKRLLYEEKFTIEGARRKLEEMESERDRQLGLPFNDSKYLSLLKTLKRELMSIRKLLH
ncbi:MAG TPA: MerR family transcriptional regulator [Deltaproteobacteria bacterium]|nr:MerR family transcriptional regulator [Deltaproteobacteria bacterium]